MSDDARTQAIYDLIQAFAAVMTEEDEVAQQVLAVAWCNACDDFFANYENEDQQTLATYIGLALMDDMETGDLPGEVSPGIHAQVMADIFTVRALAQADDE